MKGAENIFADMKTENFPKLRKETVSYRINPKRTTPKHTVIKMARNKERILMKSSKGKATTYLQRNSQKAIS